LLNNLDCILYDYVYYKFFILAKVATTFFFSFCYIFVPHYQGIAPWTSPLGGIKKHHLMTRVLGIVWKNNWFRWCLEKYCQL